MSLRFYLVSVSGVPAQTGMRIDRRLCHFIEKACPEALDRFAHTPSSDAVHGYPRGREGLERVGSCHARYHRVSAMFGGIPGSFYARSLIQRGAGIGVRLPFPGLGVDDHKVRSAAEALVYGRSHIRPHGRHDRFHASLPFSVRCQRDNL